MGCNFADEALQAVSSLLLMGCGKWWTGPKLQLLEITCQGNTQHTGRRSCAPLPPSVWHHMHVHVPGLFMPIDRQPRLTTLSCAGDRLPPGKPDSSQPQHSSSLVAQLQTGVPPSSKSSGLADASNAAASAVAGSGPALGSLPTADSPAAAAAAAASQQAGVTSAQGLLLAEAGASQTDRSAGPSTAGISLPGVAAMPVRISQARKPLKTLSAVSPQVAMQQRLQQTRSSMELVSHTQVPPADLPVTFAVSTLLQPGPLFIRSFPDTGLDSSTTLPQAIATGRHGRGLTATTATCDIDEAGLWKSTTWGQGTAQRFGPEALTSLSSALGTIGVQLTVLTLSYVDLGDAGMHILCRGISRYVISLQLSFHCCHLSCFVKHVSVESHNPHHASLAVCRNSVCQV